MNKEPGQTYWEAKYKDTPWSDAHEYARAEAREIEEACREGFVPKPLVDAVMRWRDAALSGTVELAEDVSQEIVARVIQLVLGKKAVGELLVAIKKPFKGPVEVGGSYSTRLGKTVECWHITGGIAHCTLGPHRAADGVSCTSRELDIVAESSNKQAPPASEDKKMPQPKEHQRLLDIVMRWLEAARAGDEKLTEYCVGEAFLRAAKLVLDEDVLEEVERLYVTPLLPNELNPSVTQKISVR